MLQALAVEHIRQRAFEPMALAKPMTVDELPTPALVLDRPALERNIGKMAEFLGGHGKGFRPHAKTHKCPIIAKRQLEAGAVGICTAKVSEAVALKHAGVERILVTSPIVTDAKAEVVNDLAVLAENDDGGELMLVVDSMEGLDVLRRNVAQDRRISLLVDVDVSMGRTGTRSDDMLLNLVDEAIGDERFAFRGIQHYAGHVMHIAGFAERRTRSLELWERLLEHRACLTDRGIAVDVVTGCGTGTYNIDVAVEAITDLQVGSYVFMDEEYLQIGGPDTERFEDFEVSLTVACTAISQPTARAMTFDGGYKSFASETVMPVTDRVPDARFRFAGDEHGVLIFAEGQQEVQLGDVVEFVTPHCDPTVNLHELYWVREADGMVHECWPITARGCSW